MIPEIDRPVVYRIHPRWGTACKVYPSGEDEELICGEGYRRIMEEAQFSAFCYQDYIPNPGRPQTGFAVSEREGSDFSIRPFYVEANPYKDIKGAFTTLAEDIDKKIGDRHSCTIIFTG